MKYIITFASVHFVMKAEKMLKEKAIKVRLVPTPRKISSDCGMAIEVNSKDINIIKELLKDGENIVESIHELTP